MIEGSFCVEEPISSPNLYDLYRRTTAFSPYPELPIVYAYLRFDRLRVEFCRNWREAISSSYADYQGGQTTFVAIIDTQTQSRLIDEDVSVYWHQLQQERDTYNYSREDES